MDFANLGINIDSSSAASAARALDNLADVGEQTERRVNASMNDITESMTRAASTSGVSAERMSRQSRASVSNLTYQISDIAQMLAVGQSPFILMMQQGDQVSGAMRDLAGEGGTKGVIGAVGMAIRNLFNPLTLATYAFIGFGALAVGWLTKVFGETESLEKQVKSLSGTFKEFFSYIDVATEDIDKLTAKYGSAAQAARELNVELAANKRAQLENELSTFLSDNLDPFGLGNTFKGLQTGVVADFFGLDRDFMVFTQAARQARDELDATIQGMIDATNRLDQASGLEEQTVALQNYLDVFVQLADMDGQRTQDEVDRIDLMGQILDKMYEQIGAEERLKESLASGASAAATQSEEVLAAQESILASIRGIIDSTKGLFSEAFNSSGGIGEAIIQGITSGLQSAASGLYATVRELATNASKTFKSILGIKSPSRVFRQHGRDIGAGLEQGIEDSNSGVMNAMEGLATGVTDAFVGLFSGSLRSVKDFLQAIKSSFMSMLSDLLRAAISNPIRIAFGLSPIGSAASAAVAGGTGGGGGLLGGLFSKFTGGFGTAGGGIFGAIGGGTGLLGGLGNALSGGLGNVLNIFGNAAAAGGGLAATIGAAIPVIGAVALVLGFFRKKVTLLDSGFRLTIDNMSTLVETFKKTKTTRFFGLSKKVATSYKEADAEFADPVKKAVSKMYEGIIGLANSIGLAGEDIMKEFATQLKVSTKGMSDEQAQQAVVGAFETLNDEMAAWILYNAEGLPASGAPAATTQSTGTTSALHKAFGARNNEHGNILNSLVNKTKEAAFVSNKAPDWFVSKFALDGETALQTLQRLSASLQAVNAAWDMMNFTLRQISVAGAGAAAELVNLVGGLDNFGSLSEYFYQNYFSEAERRVKATEILTSKLADLGEALPKSKADYRSLLSEATATGDNELAAVLLQYASTFDFIVGKTSEAANQMAQAQMTLFRTRAEQVYAQTSDGYKQAVEAILSEDDKDLLREVVRAVREGDINNARISSRMLAIAERGDLEPVA